MNNFEIGERLLQEAREFLPEMKRAFERGSWNIVMRRAQEMERQYSRADATRAREGAERVLALVGRLAERIRGTGP